MHYEEIPIDNEDHSSDASTYDSGITVGKQLASFTSPTNIVVTEAIIENRKPFFLNSTTNSCYNNQLAQIHRAEKVDDICCSSSESTSKNTEYCEIYCSVQRQKKKEKFNANWYESLNKIEIDSSNGEVKIVPDDGFFDAKEDITDNVSIGFVHPVIVLYPSFVYENTKSSLFDIIVESLLITEICISYCLI